MMFNLPYVLGFSPDCSFRSFFYIASFFFIHYPLHFLHHPPAPPYRPKYEKITLIPHAFRIFTFIRIFIGRFSIVASGSCSSPSLAVTCKMHHMKVFPKNALFRVFPPTQFLWPQLQTFPLARVSLPAAAREFPSLAGVVVGGRGK